MRKKNNLLTLRTGLDVLLESSPSKSSRTDIFRSNIGLITNRSAITRRGVPGIDALLAADAHVRSILVPEHGLRGEFAAGADVPSSNDRETGLPVFSLYGSVKRPTAEMLQGLDLLLFDIQDVGARFYTYLYTMSYAMQSAAEAGMRFIVLDRPNPITGTEIEGPILQPEFSSFVGLHPIPIRTGMTIGELALFFNSECGIGADLHVIPMDGWQRRMWFSDTGLPWVPPSPGIPTPETALVYPGTCLLEGTNLSEGRGTGSPFLTIGAPWLQGTDLADKLNGSGLPGVVFEPSAFQPNASKHAGRSCGGVNIVVEDRDSFRPVLTGLKIIEIALRISQDRLEFNPPGPDGRRFFDLLAGTDRVRKQLEAGSSGEEISASWDLSVFHAARHRHLLYT